MRLLPFSCLILFLAAAGFFPIAGQAEQGVVAQQAEDKTVPWTELDNETRQAIVQAWLEQDEMKRAVFPVFRDQWLRANNATGDHLRPQAVKRGKDRSMRPPSSAP